MLDVSIGTGTDFNYLLKRMDAKRLEIVGAVISMGILHRAQRVWRRRLRLALVSGTVEDLPFFDNIFGSCKHSRLVSVQ